MKSMPINDVIQFAREKRKRDQIIKIKKNTILLSLNFFMLQWEARYMEFARVAYSLLPLHFFYAAIGSVTWNLLWVSYWKYNNDKYWYIEKLLCSEFSNSLFNFIYYYHQKNKVF